LAERKSGARNHKKKTVITRPRPNGGIKKTRTKTKTGITRPRPNGGIIILISYANKAHFHKKGFAFRLVLEVRGFGIRKWPVLFRHSSTLYGKKKLRFVAWHSTQLYIRTHLSGAIVFLGKDSRIQEDGDKLFPRSVYFGGSHNSSSRSVSKLFRTTERLSKF